MAFDAKIILKLDREREIRWTTESSPKLGRLEEPPALEHIFHRNPHRGLFALCAWVWAALVDDDQDFAKPEALARYLETPEAQKAAYDALVQALRNAGVLKPEKKTEPSGDAGKATSPAGADSSSSGPRPSSSSARPVRRSRS